MTGKLGGLAAWVALVALAPSTARAGQEASDLKRQLETQQAGISDLERLDQERRASDEITRLKTWIDEGFAQLAKEKFERVREVNDRCIAQAELVRQRITANQQLAKAAEREAYLAKAKERLERTKADLQQVQVQKKAMEMGAP